MRIVLLGGAGYIGIHVAVALAAAGHDPIVVDSLVTGRREAVERARALTGRSIPLLEADVRDEDALSAFFADQGPIDAMVMLAGLKAVGESVTDPLRYYSVNLGVALAATRLAKTHGIGTILFSSSATVYSGRDGMPVTEASETGTGQSNPYGRTKRMIEEILTDVAAADPSLRVTVLRYFNPIGADASGRLGEDPQGTPTNVMPLIARAAAGTGAELVVFGDDYDTPDGTALRDYIHVADLADAHVAALENAPDGYRVYNIGTGRPVSVLELIAAFEEASGTPVPHRIGARRPGDLPVSYADAAAAARDLGWRAQRSMADACRDMWRWQQDNPHGYVKAIH